MYAAILLVSARGNLIRARIVTTSPCLSIDGGVGAKAVF
jgi:hypothetical protein